MILAKNEGLQMEKIDWACYSCRYTPKRMSNNPGLMG